MAETAKKTGKRGPRPGAAKRKPKAKSKGLDPAKDFDEPVKRTPKTGRLPGMEDSPIKDLEEAAIEHSNIQSEIVAKRGEMRDSKTRLVTLMKKAGKTKYNHNGIVLKLKEGHDDVSVQVKRHDKKGSNDVIDVAPADEESGEITG